MRKIEFPKSDINKTYLEENKQPDITLNVEVKEESKVWSVNNEFPNYKSEDHKFSEISNDENSTDPDNYTPISALSQINPNWIILAKVTNIHVKPYKNIRGSGRVMNVDLIDHEGSDIQMTGFNESVDKFEGYLKVNKVYRISNWNLKVSNRKFTSISHDYCLIISSNTKIEEVEKVKRLTRYHWA